MNEELLKALGTIKEECRRHVTRCTNCPLQTSEGECGITSMTPDDWPLKKKEVYFYETV